MGIILALIPVITFVAFAGLFFRRFRKRVALLLVASLVERMIAVGVELENQNEVARQAGFRDHQDFVDAQNGFGAQIRTLYRAIMERNPDSGSWRLIKLDM